MDIDMFLATGGRCGLLCKGLFDVLPAGVLFDAETLELTVEFLNDDPFHLNIPVDLDLRDKVLFTDSVYFAFLQGGQIQDTIQVPIMYLNDPYTHELTTKKSLDQPVRSIRGFESFIHDCQFAQAVHRIDAGNEESSHSVMHGQNLQSLEYAPQLQRQRQLENAPQAPSAPGLQAIPQGPGMKGPGGTSINSSHIRRAHPQRRSNNDDGNSG